MVRGTYTSIITLNVNGLNAPTKRHRLAEWIQKPRPIYMLSTRNPLQTSKHTDWKREHEKIYSMKIESKGKLE